MNQNEPHKPDDQRQSDLQMREDPSDHAFAFIDLRPIPSIFFSSDPIQASSIDFASLSRDLHSWTNVWGQIKSAFDQAALQQNITDYAIVFQPQITDIRQRLTGLHLHEYALVIQNEADWIVLGTEILELRRRVEAIPTIADQDLIGVLKHVDAVLALDQLRSIDRDHCDNVCKGDIPLIMMFSAQLFSIERSQLATISM